MRSLFVRLPWTNSHQLALLFQTLYLITTVPFVISKLLIWPSPVFSAHLMTCIMHNQVKHAYSFNLTYCVLITASSKFCKAIRAIPLTHVLLLPYQDGAGKRSGINFFGTCSSSKLFQALNGTPTFGLSNLGLLWLSMQWAMMLIAYAIHC